MEDQKKIWTTDEIVDLIEVYRTNTNLWNYKDINYKNRNKRMTSLRKMAMVFDTNVAEVKRKIDILVSQYHRERRHHINMTKNGADEDFTPKWFGYKLLGFLHDKNRAKRVLKYDIQSQESSTEVNTEEIKSAIVSIPTENVGGLSNEKVNAIKQTNLYNSTLCKQEELEITTEDRSTYQNHPTTEIYQYLADQTSPQKQPTISPEQQKVDYNKDVTDLFNMLKSTFEKQNVMPIRSEYDVFGEMVAHNIKNLKTEYAKITVQHRISNLLYEARLGWFDAPVNENVKSPPVSTSSATTDSDTSSQNTINSVQQLGNENPTEWTNTICEQNI